MNVHYYMNDDRHFALPFSSVLVVSVLERLNGLFFVKLLQVKKSTFRSDIIAIEYDPYVYYFQIGSKLTQIGETNELFRKCMVICTSRYFISHFSSLCLIC